MPRQSATPRSMDPACVLLTVEQAARRLGVGRSTMYGLIAQGEVESIQIGHLRRIPVDALTDFVARRRVPGSALGA